MDEQPPFEVGKVYSRTRDIHDIIGGSRQSGISTPKNWPRIFLFTGTSGEQHGYQDGWDTEGVFPFFGEGQRGDMELVRGNRAIGDHAGASVFYREGLALPRAPPDTCYLLHNNLGCCLNEAGRHADAEGHCRAAIAIDPERHNAHKNLGVALEGQGRLAEAADAFIRAVQRNPRALPHLERLLASHPALAEADPSLVARVEVCRALANGARRTVPPAAWPKLSG
jgi:tetratricopeptide (TPR) repeat protein